MGILTNVVFLAEPILIKHRSEEHSARLVEF